MRHTDEDIERSAARFDQLAERIDPESAKVVITEGCSTPHRGSACAEDTSRYDKLLDRGAVRKKFAKCAAWITNR